MRGFMDQEVLVDGYDNSLIEIILGKVDKTTSVAFAEYGRGSDALYRYFEDKCKSASAPGQHGQRRGRLSDYGLQLREKQKVRRFYGVQVRAW